MRNGVDINGEFDNIQGDYVGFDIASVIDQSKEFLQSEKGQALVKKGLETGATIKANREASGKTQRRRDLKDICGSRFKPLFNKKKKGEWLKCKADYDKQVADAQAGGGAGDTKSSTPPPTDPEGMSMGAKIGIGVGIAAVLGVGIYFIVKK